MLQAARTAEDIVARTFSGIYHIDRAIFSASATAEQRLAAARVRLPTSLAGAGLRSMVTISLAAYFASLRAVASSTFYSGKGAMPKPVKKSRYLGERLFLPQQILSAR